MAEEKPKSGKVVSIKKHLAIKRLKALYREVLLKKKAEALKGKTPKDS